MIRSILLAVGLLAIMAGVTIVHGGALPPAAASADELVTPAELRAVAATVYDGLAAGRTAGRDDIAELFGLFGIPVLDSGDGPAFQKQLDSGEPFLLDFQADALAQALSEGWFVSVDSLLAALAVQEAETTDGQPLTRTYLDAALQPLLTRQRYDAADVLPAFVLKLGQERARVFPAATPDPVWGDGLLDSVQFNLLLISLVGPADPAALQALAGPSGQAATPALLHIAGLPGLNLSVAPTLSGLVPKAAKMGVKGKITSFIGQLIRFPLGPVDSARAAVCASIMLYSYRFEIHNEAQQLVKRQSGHPEKPYQSEIRATLNFDFQRDTESLPKELGLWLAGCDLPESGHVTGKPVTWKLTDDLPEVGAFAEQEAVTDSLGQVRAIYRTVAETVPEELRTFSRQREANGVVEVRAGELLPGKWSSLEAVVRFLNPEIDSAPSRMSVTYYEPAGYTLELDLAFRMNNSMTPAGYQWKNQVTGSFPLEPVNGLDGRFEGRGVLTYASLDYPMVSDTTTISFELHDGWLQAALLVDPDDGSFSLTLDFLEWPASPGTMVKKDPYDPFTYDMTNDWRNFGWQAHHGSGDTFVIDGWQLGDGVASKFITHSTADGASVISYLEESLFTLVPR